MNKAKEKYIKQVLNPFKISAFFLSNLPSVIFWGVKVKSISESKSEVTIPYGWRTRNPFKSMYFAAQAGAAELSTGMLVQSSFQGRGKWSMYVIGFRAEYGVTAKTKVLFTCNDGHKLNSVIDEIESTGVPQEIVLESTGVNTEGKMVSKFYITWSLKKK